MRTEDDGLLDELTAIRPDQRDVYATSLRATVRRDLLGATAEPFRLGRYTVLEPIGGGGMGVVFVAYDPDLDRKIALKVLRGSGARGRRDVLREGRALAQLRHPNVVTVYEVGVLDEHEYVAMEYVEGDNLRGWLRGSRSAATILARLVEAGRGLAAAHAVGLVHSDIKPENLVIDGEGHARVIDFGLARALAEPHADGASVGEPQATGSARGGTPAYMAPERLAGGAGDRGSDQYSYCVTCWEALYGARPDPTDPRAPHGRGVSGWVRRVLERGLARDPARRWPTMDALLAALERDRTRARARRAGAVILGVAALGIAVEGVRRRDVAQRVAACEDAAAEIDAAWNDDARQRLRDAFAATGASDAVATADRVIPRLDEQVAAWKRARTDACSNASVHALWGADIRERAVFCLEDRQLTLTALVSEFARADATTVREAVPAVAGLKSVDACMDEGLLRRLPAPPERGDETILAVRAELSRAGSLGLAGKYKEGLAAATEARVRAEAVREWPSLWAAARTEEGRYLERTGDYEQSEVASTEAYFAAARAGAWAVAAEAATNAIANVGYRRARHAEGRMWARHAEVAIGHAGDWSGLAEATRLNHLAMVEKGAGAYAESRTLGVRALEIREAALGPDHPGVAMALGNVAIAYYEEGAYAEAQPLHERARVIWERELGPDHPYVATSLHNLAMVRDALGAHAEALALAGRALEIREKTLGPEHARVALTLNNLATMHKVAGDLAEAKELYERSLRIQEKVVGREHPDVAVTVSNLASLQLAMGDYEEAKRLEARALAIREKALGPDHPDVSYSVLNLASAHAKAGDLPAALPLFARALAIIERSLGPEHPTLIPALVMLGGRHVEAGKPRDGLPSLERAVAVADAHAGLQKGETEARFELARALVATGGDRARALAEVRKARDAAREAGQAEVVADAEKWLAEHGGG